MKAVVSDQRSVVSPAVRRRVRALRRSALHLAEYAIALRESHTVSGEWVIRDATDRSAKADHDEMVLLCRQLRALARRKS